MARHEIPITPNNYTVWYRYVSKADAELCKTISTMIDRREKFSDKKNRELYAKFCEDKTDVELKKIREDLQQILVIVFRQVTELTGQADEYEEFVSESINKLSDEASVQEIKNVVGKIINKTKALGSYGKNLQHQLKETTSALETLKKDFERAKSEALVDFLTGVPNRKAFDDTLAKLTGNAVSGGKDLSLLMIDIDHFKKFNDEHGHMLGDKVLKFVAQKIRDLVRGRDFVARFGGEEFAVLLSQTSLDGARVVAEGIRSYFAQSPLKGSATSRNLGTITVSIGVACYRPGEAPEELISRSDEALYSAKKHGRNRVTSESEVL
jgi:diguanylate cyclase